jgi:hypothetical protein
MHVPARPTQRPVQDLHLDEPRDDRPGVFGQGVEVHLVDYIRDDLDIACQGRSRDWEGGGTVCLQQEGAQQL